MKMAKEAFLKMLDEGMKKRKQRRRAEQDAERDAEKDAESMLIGRSLDRYWAMRRRYRLRK